MKESLNRIVRYGVVRAFFYCLFLYSLTVSNAFAEDALNTLEVNAASFGVKPGSHDSTAKVAELLTYIKEHNITKVTFARGEYHFYPGLATEDYAFISNNDQGLKRIAFYLDDINNLTINGQGSSFIMHGGINPFILQGASNISIKNLSIDFNRPFHNEGVILAVGEGFMDLHIPEAFPYIINDAGILEFQGVREYPPGYPINEKLERRKDALHAQDYVFKRLLEYDVNTRATAYMASDIQTGAWLKAEALSGKNNIRIFHPKLKGTVGNIMTFSSKYRKYPAIVISDSSDVLLDNVTIFHAGGMGVLGQRCRNVTIQNSQVTPSKDRIISATADATHFNNCNGDIKLVNNLFENQQDDATNIHGIYAMFQQLKSPNTALIKIQHPQQWGFNFIDVGDTMELVQGSSLITYGTNTVAKVKKLNTEIYEVTFDDPIDPKIVVGDSIAEVRDYASVLIKGNTIRRNRARGMLLNSRGKTVVEDNYFHVPGAAILFEGDARNWYEQGGVRNVTIRNNIFDNSHFSIWGKAIIAVAAGIDKEFQDVSRYNKNILIQNNTFNVYDKGLLLDLFSVSNVTFKNNKVNKTDFFPTRTLKTPEFFRTRFSDGVVIKDNEFLGFD
ncbi:right-handed parallel beta-helix repeat-containing protein [Paraglaciecola chathamensis]|uniref:right-handed parallel beta-helix repeat-containing protein n=1 Tax=Paraglaciecola chathamensis TaxID=368405 RepID=UPI0027025D24|nr:right-handed parallel beta-helix repeat-containing protein [Paraglaciecola chathamensis]MDO6840195.1 right-handed parallel beta-helix repeat-containing protein [Paraglaciecola chathamensis]